MEPKPVAATKIHQQKNPTVKNQKRWKPKKYDEIVKLVMEDTEFSRKNEDYFIQSSSRFPLHKHHLSGLNGNMYLPPLLLDIEKLYPACCLMKRNPLSLLTDYHLAGTCRRLPF